jgi:molybdate transport system substrate-binding protein
MANTIRVLSTIAMRTVLDAAAPAFERAHRISVERVINSSIALMRRIAEGETADVALFTAAAIDELIAQGKMLARTDLVRSGVGVAVRKGSPKPDIGTAEKFKRALLSAKSVAHSKTGASGIYFVQLVERLGIAEAVRGKAKVIDGVVAELAARGEAELAIQQVSELMQAPGVDIVGPLPDELQQITIFSAGVFTGAAQIEAANSFVAFLASPAQAALIRANGMEPL